MYIQEIHILFFVHESVQPFINFFTLVEVLSCCRTRGRTRGWKISDKPDEEPGKHKQHGFSATGGGAAHRTQAEHNQKHGAIYTRDSDVTAGTLFTLGADFGFHDMHH